MANEVRFTIKLNVDGQSKVVDATTSVDELTEAIGEVRKAADTVGQSKGWETMMLGVNSAMDVLGKLKDAVDGLAGDFESWETAMAAVNTMAGKDAAGLAQLTDQVGDLSKVIPKAREELAEGLYQTISNGVPEADWLTFLEQSAKASVGGIADLGETVKGTSTVIKNYGLEWSQAGEIQDKIQMTAKNGVTSFGELASALPRVTANAATLGVSIDELMATFATLTGVSGDTAEVSTQLAAIFTAPVKPPREATSRSAARSPLLSQSRRARRRRWPRPWASNLTRRPSRQREACNSSSPSSTRPSSNTPGPTGCWSRRSTAACSDRRRACAH